MASIGSAWKSWYFGRRFSKRGKKFRLSGNYIEIKGDVQIGDACRFRNNVVLNAGNHGQIIFGDRSGCSWNVIITASKLVQIGTFTGIAENTVIRDTNHLMYGTDKHWRYTPLIAEPIIIGKECFIGSGCYIGPGITIGDGAVIGHGSIVTKDVGEYEIWNGRPARFTAHRTKNVPENVLKHNLELAKEYGVRKDRYTDTPEGGSVDSGDDDL